MTRPRVLAAAVALALMAVPGFAVVSQAGQPEVRNSRFFQVDVTGKKAIGPAPYVSGALHLSLVSVSVDQPQYWPDEKVHLKVMMPGRPGARFTASLQKRDANRQQLKGEFDAQGVAVLVAMDGTRKRLEVGEYRIDVRTEDGRAAGSATFSVAEGTLGAVSLAHEFKKVTSVEELEKADGAWFLGNAAGAGKRWGNGLNFKNELRVANQPYDGEVQCISRCMLPGCNGIQAGPTRTYRAEKGKIQGTMEVGGHSGPFQLELVTPKGSLRHQFEGSSHVEREMMLASGGVGSIHRVGLAPYERTVPVPGRQLFLEKQRDRGGDADAFEIDSLIARRGELPIEVKREVRGAALVVWTPKPDGTFEPRPVEIKGGILRPGQQLVARVATPYSLVTVGGFAGSSFVEGWALAFPPSEVRLDLEVPAAAAPGRAIQVGVSARGEDGAGAAVSGILEVFDNRVASRSPMSALASTLGDSVRNTSGSVASWRDNTGIDELAKQEKRKGRGKAGLAMEPERDEAPAPMEAAPPPPPARAPAAPMMKMSRAQAGGLGGRIRSGGGGAGAVPGDDEEPLGAIREGERKVVFCEAVRTDASGKAAVQVTLPPQIGRVSVRFVAVRGLDHGSVQEGLDVAKKASVEASMPKVFVPGAQLSVPVVVANALQETVTLRVAGEGIPGGFTRSVAPGSMEVAVPWAPAAGGKVSLELADPRGKVVDKRELPVHSLAAQPVTFSRLVVVGKEPVALGAGETAVAYPGPGALLRGIVMNMVTTMESWFGHAEALSAQVAAKAVILSAISRKVLDDDEGLAPTLRASLDKATRDLEQAFLDPQTNLVRPYPDLPPNPLWSAWTSANLHAAVRVLQADPALKTSMSPTIARAASMASRLDAALKAKGFSLEQHGYDAEGRAVIPVEVGGKVVYRVLTDDAVTRWVGGKLLPALDLAQESLELAFAKAYDQFRFLRAFQRVGALQYATEAATALWLKGDRAHFDPLFARITRGMILAQEPGMVQGPATLGGVYSTPMAMVRFLELLLAMGESRSAAGATLTVRTDKGTRTVKMGEAIPGAPGTTLLAPEGAVLRIDKAGMVPLTELPRQARPLGTADLAPRELALAGEAVVTVTLDAALDPLEYYAIVAVPATTAIKQTEDILSDYRGQLVYGQQAAGGSKMQLLAVPFRGSRTLRLLLEGAWPGTAPGVVAIRHIENPSESFALKLPAVRVAGDH